MNGFFVTKDSSNAYRWLCVYTNSIEDLDGEILTAAAHQEEVAAAMSGEFPLPPLWICHNPKWKIGQTDIKACDEIAPGVVFVIASGTFDEGMEAVAERLKDTPAAMSHGLYVIETGEFNGVKTVERYRTHEISVLPEGIALPANPRTYYFVEDAMGIREELQRSKLGQLLGIEAVEAIENANTAIAAKALEDGVVYKSADEAVEVTVTEVVIEDVPDTADEEVEEVVAGHSDEAVAYVTAVDLEALATLIGEGFKALRDDLNGEQARLREELEATKAQVSAAVADTKNEIEKSRQESVTPVAARPGFEALLKSMTRTDTPVEAKKESVPPVETDPKSVQRRGPIGLLAAVVEN